MATSWTVVMGPRSGMLLALRRRAMGCWFNLTLSAGIVPSFSEFLLLFIARAKAVSGSTDEVLLGTGDCLPLGKS